MGNEKVSSYQSTHQNNGRESVRDEEGARIAKKQKAQGGCERGKAVQTLSGIGCVDRGSGDTAFS